MNPPFKRPAGLARAVAAGWLIAFAVSAESRAADRRAQRATPVVPPVSKAVPQAPADAESVPNPLPKPTEDEEKTSAASLATALRETNYARRIHHLYAAVEKMLPGELASAIGQAPRLAERDRSLLQSMLFEKWAQTDPRAALEFALSLTGYDRYVATGAALEVWAAADSHAAIAWTQKLPPGDPRSTVLQLLIDALAKRDPAAALQFLRTLPRDQFAADAYSIIFTAWAARDPRTAASQLLSTPRWQSGNWQNRESVASLITMHWAETDPAAALAWARELPDASARRVAVERAFEGWANVDPKAACAALLALPPGTARSRLAGNLVRTLGNRDVPSAIQLIEQMPAGETRNEATQNLAAQWAISDPVAAAAYAAALPPGNARTSALLGVASQWARQDPPAAVAYFSALPPDGTRDAALRDIAGIFVDTDVAAALALVDRLSSDETKKEAQRDIINRWARKEPRAAADYCLRKSLYTDEQGGALAQVLAEWATQSPEQALAWVRQIREEKVRGKLLGSIVYRMAGTDPELAAGQFAKLPVANQRDVASEIASRWSRLDPAAAAAWVVQLPEGEARSWAQRSIASQWAALDPSETARWLEHLPASASRDASIQAFGEATRHAAPEMAVALANTISDPRQRDTALASIAHEWLRTDKKAALKWLGESTAMSAEMKKQVLSQ